jgi:hypothetical protein
MEKEGIMAMMECQVQVASEGTHLAVEMIWVVIPMDPPIMALQPAQGPATAVVPVALEVWDRWVPITDLLPVEIPVALPKAEIMAEVMADLKAGIGKLNMQTISKQ